MKKEFVVFVLGLFMVSMFAGFVSAASDFEGMMYDLGDGIDSVYTSLLEPILGKIIGETKGDSNTSTSELFLAKVLFLVIILSVVWAALNKVGFFNENAWVLWLVSISASILSVRWFGNADVIRSIILPYSVLGVAISAGLPFILSFLIIENNFRETMRKFAWIFFAVVFVGLWATRIGSTEFAFIYLVTALLAVVVMLFDGTIQKIMNKISAEKLDIVHRKTMINELKKDIEEINARYRNEGDEYEGVYSTKKGRAGWIADKDSIRRRIADLKSN